MTLKITKALLKDRAYSLLYKVNRNKVINLKSKEVSFIGDIPTDSKVIHVLKIGVSGDNLCDIKYIIKREFDFKFVFHKGFLTVFVIFENAYGTVIELIIIDRVFDIELFGTNVYIPDNLEYSVILPTNKVKFINDIIHLGNNTKFDNLPNKLREVVLLTTSSEEVLIPNITKKDYDFNPKEIEDTTDSIFNKILNIMKVLKKHKKLKLS